VKHFSLEDILTVILAQLEEGLRGYKGYGEQNQEVEEILNFVVAYDLIITNTFFRKKKIPLIYFQQWPILEPDRFYPY
jgi:hypothetical protein